MLRIQLRERIANSTLTCEAWFHVVRNEENSLKHCKKGFQSRKTLLKKTTAFHECRKSMMHVWWPCVSRISAIRFIIVNSMIPAFERNLNSTKLPCHNVPVATSSPDLPHSPYKFCIRVCYPLIKTDLMQWKSDLFYSMIILCKCLAALLDWSMITVSKIRRSKKPCQYGTRKFLVIVKRSINLWNVDHG